MEDPTRNKNEIAEQFIRRGQDGSPTNGDIDPGPTGWICTALQTPEGSTDTFRRERGKGTWVVERGASGLSYPSPAGGAARAGGRGSRNENPLTTRRSWRRRRRRDKEGFPCVS